MEPQIIHGPTAPAAAGGNIVYHVTLASGAIATNPGAFGLDDPALYVGHIVTNDGRILGPPAPVDESFGLAETFGQDGEANRQARLQRLASRSTSEDGFDWQQLSTADQDMWGSDDQA